MSKELRRGPSGNLNNRAASIQQLQFNLGRGEQMKRRAIQFGFVVLLAFSTMRCLGQNSSADRLHQAFVDPPHDFSVMPFWFWNGKMEGPVVQQQVREMVDQHVYGAFLHGRDGLQTPYLSEDWFKAIGAGLEQSKKSGFEFNFVDEYDWPSGEVRNVWMAGNHQSEVLARRPMSRKPSTGRG
jgi:hypothetical protein